MSKKIIFTLIIGVIIAGFAVAQENVVVPYILKAPAPITVDGELDEWAFAFPLDHNAKSIPDSGRFKAENPGWVPMDPEDCSGTLYMMYDEEYFYFAGYVMDDEPGHFSDAIWAADAIEFYLANYDVGEALFPQDAGGWPNDPDNGQYAVQITIAFDESLDSLFIQEWYGVGGLIMSENTKATYMIWDEGNGYTIEGQVYLPDLDSPTTGNIFEFTPGTRIPASWSLYDMDETESSADFQGFAYTPKGYAGWMGVGPGWQVADVLETPRGFEWNDMATFDFVHPYIKKAYRPVEIDGVLDEWNFCFPADHWRSIIPDSGRFNFENPGWFPADDEDLKGTLYCMWDEEYFYFASHVMDDEPVHFSDAIWAADATEFYLCNYDIGDAYHPMDAGGWPNDPDNGDYGLQITTAFDESQDSVFIQEWYGVGANIFSETSYAVYRIWDEGNGYDLEGKVFLPDLDSPTTGNIFEFIEGNRIPFMWSLYDIDETESSADFQGLAYTPKGFAGWMGPGDGWQYADVKGVSVIEYIDVLAQGGTVAIQDVNNAAVPTDFALTNYPNPFNPSTNIKFTVDNNAEVNLNIYNIRGQLVKNVLKNELRTVGSHVVSVDMSDMPSGMYISVLEQNNTTVTNKMLLMK